MSSQDDAPAARVLECSIQYNNGVSSGLDQIVRLPDGKHFVVQGEFSSRTKTETERFKSNRGTLKAAMAKALATNPDLFPIREGDPKSLMWQQNFVDPGSVEYIKVRDGKDLSPSSITYSLGDKETRLFFSSPFADVQSRADALAAQTGMVRLSGNGESIYARPGAFDLKTMSDVNRSIRQWDKYLHISLVFNGNSIKDVLPFDNGKEAKQALETLKHMIAAQRPSEVPAAGPTAPT